MCKCEKRYLFMNEESIFLIIFGWSDQGERTCPDDMDAKGIETVFMRCNYTEKKGGFGFRVIFERTLSGWF